LLLGLHWFTWRETRGQTRAFRLLATLMVGLTGVLLASAFLRMALYEEAYGYTHLRLFVHVFEVWLGALFGWLLVTLWFRPKQFAIGGFVAVLGFLATLNLMNPDSTIADWNLLRYAATGKVDIYYLGALSEDAVPKLLEGIGKLQGEERDWLLRTLGTKLDQMRTNKGWQEIPSFNFGRWQAYQALEENQVRLTQVQYGQTGMDAPGESEFELLSSGFDR
jgi:Domain of unknown function (DUF4153)